MFIGDSNSAKLIDFYTSDIFFLGDSISDRFFYLRLTLDFLLLFF
jgi:hypothetical protein